MKFCTKCGTQLDDDEFFCTNCGNQAPLPNFQEKEFNPSNNNETNNINHENAHHPLERPVSTKPKPNKRNKAYLCSIVIGVVLFLVGLFIPVPGGALTTYESLDGEKTEYYAFDDKYTTIDEYVGGDAYNYIIGASLVAGKISGTMTTKAVFIVGGTLCLCLGTTLALLTKRENN